jgi:hypothetical protein
MKQKLINIILWILPDWFVLAITMHGLRNNKLPKVAPYVCLRMAEIALNTPDCESNEFSAHMDIMGKRYKVKLECTWEEL